MDECGKLRRCHARGFAAVGGEAFANFHAVHDAHGFGVQPRHHFLRQRGLPLWPPNHPALARFKALRCANLDEFRAWMAQEQKRHGQTRTNTDVTRSVSVGEGPCSSVPTPVLVANAALSLLNLCCYLLDRQLAAQAEAFETEGGFTERLYRVRTERRARPNPNPEP